MRSSAPRNATGTPRKIWPLKTLVLCSKPPSLVLRATRGILCSRFGVCTMNFQRYLNPLKAKKDKIYLSVTWKGLEGFLLLNHCLVIWKGTKRFLNVSRRAHILKHVGVKVCVFIRIVAMVMTLSKGQLYSLCVIHSKNYFCHCCPFGDLFKMENPLKNIPMIYKAPCHFARRWIYPF